MVVGWHQSMRLMQTLQAPKSFHPPAGEHLADQQRLPQLGISLDPLAELQMGRKMAARNFPPRKGFPPPTPGAKFEKGLEAIDR